MKRNVNQNRLVQPAPVQQVQPVQPVQQVQPVQELIQPVQVEKQRKPKPSSKANAEKAREARKQKVLEKKKADAERYLKSLQEQQMEDDDDDTEVITIKTAKVKRSTKKEDVTQTPVPYRVATDSLLANENELVQKLKKENEELLKRLECNDKKTSSETKQSGNGNPHSRPEVSFARNNYRDVDSMVKAMKSKIINFK